MNTINQIYQAQIQLTKGCKIDLLNKGFGYTLRFKEDKQGYYKELDVKILIPNQKTVTTSKPTFVTVKSFQTIEDIGEQIQFNETFIILDIDGKIGKGKIIEILQQD